MFDDHAAFDLQVPDVSALSSYNAKVRAAHEVANLLKRTRPHLCEQVSALQARVTQCQNALDQAKAQMQQRSTPTSYQDRQLQLPPALEPAALNALRELERAVQALLELQHKEQMP